MDAHDVLRGLMKRACASSGLAAHRKLFHAGGDLVVEVNGGIYFMHHVTGFDVIEVTTTQALTLIEQDEI